MSVKIMKQDDYDDTATEFEARVIYLIREIQKIQEPKWDRKMAKILLTAAHIGLRAEEEEGFDLLSEIMRKSVIKSILKKNWAKAEEELQLYLSTFYGKEEKNEHPKGD